MRPKQWANPVNHHLPLMELDLLIHAYPVGERFVIFFLENVTPLLGNRRLDSVY